MLTTISAAQDERAREKARIGYAANTLAFLGMFIANDVGLYTKQGLEVELIQLRPSIGIAALISGDVDYLENLGSAIRAASRGAPIRHANSRGAQEVICRRFAMDEQMAADSYHVVVSSFSKDGRIPHQGIAALLETEKKEGAIPQSVTVEQVTDSSLIDEAIKELGS
jgi:hypothetical protein